ncbi:hypothetical protein N7494_001459 [Penicillium frequentans]|uniref:Acyltransferase 3 domain-containing protein n=1 Tax=Penicillium frequentans TaxID=3151616 RepID=A0AAD6D2W6_9EURO|nr:hypothetical protein N7494_001459 [Penicillium glabrum]
MAFGHVTYLNGLRGWAALLVYCHHHELWAHQSAANLFERAYGYRLRYHFIALPYIRVLFNGGHFATATLFILSGYVMSLRPLQLIEGGQLKELAENLSSAIFRRWLRLYAPLFLTTFLYMTSWHFFGLRIRGIQPQEDYISELRMWFAEVADFSFPLSRVGSLWLSYNDHLWSVPVEMKGSLDHPEGFGSGSEVLLIIYFMYAVRDGWYMAFFMAGMLLREVEVWLETSHNPVAPTLSTRLVPHIALLFSVYLGSVPHCATASCIRKNPGWSTLSVIIPSMDLSYDPKWHYLLPAGFMFIISIKRIPWLIRLLERPFSQHLGDISYSLYLIHGPVMRILSDTVYAIFGWGEGGWVVHRYFEPLVGAFPLPTWGPLGLEVPFLVAQMFLIFLTLRAANLVTWAVEKPSMFLCRWLYLTSLPPL